VGSIPYCTPLLHPPPVPLSDALHVVSLQVVGEFDSYCRPTLHPRLSAFCTAFTGIEQAQVDAAPTLGEVVAAFDAWLAERLRATAGDGADPAEARHAAAADPNPSRGFECPGHGRRTSVLLCMPNKDQVPPVHPSDECKPHRHRDVPHGTTNMASCS
jgi:Exonuclease